MEMRYSGPEVMEWVREWTAWKARDAEDLTAKELIDYLREKFREEEVAAAMGACHD